MTEQVVIDTNVIVNYVLHDDAEQNVTANSINLFMQNYDLN